MAKAAVIQLSGEYLLKSRTLDMLRVMDQGIPGTLNEILNAAGVPISPEGEWDDRYVYQMIEDSAQGGFVYKWMRKRNG